MLPSASVTIPRFAVSRAPSSTVPVALEMVKLATASLSVMSATATAFVTAWPPLSTTPSVTFEPQVTSDPSARSATKALSLVEIETTSWPALPSNSAASSASEILPPYAASPHVTTEPSDLSAAKAPSLA